MTKTDAVRGPARSMHLKDTWVILRDAGSAWLDDKAPRLAAALAYYSVLSIAPLVIIAMAVAGLVFGQQAVEGHLSGQIQGVVGVEGAKAIEMMVANASKPSSGILAAIFGMAMLLVAAGALFGQIQDALDTVWGVGPRPGRGIFLFVRNRFLSFAMVFGIAFLFLVSLTLSTALAFLGNILTDWGMGAAGLALSFAISLAVTTLLFAMIFRFVPDAKIAWRDVWLGATVTATLFAISKFLIAIYFSYAVTASAYGAASSMAVLLIWLYYSAQVFLYGAELTKIYSNRFGSSITREGDAVQVSEART